MALTLYPKLDLTKTYFMIAGIAGVNPEVGTLGSVGISRFAIQTALSYEIDAREKPDNWTTGYAMFGGNTPLTYPGNFYGTEVFELNEALRDWAFSVSSGVKLNDSDVSVKYRAQYASNSTYAAGAALPSVIKVDTTCSDVWFSGTLLSSMFGEYVTLITNGSGICKCNITSIMIIVTNYCRWIHCRRRKCNLGVSSPSCVG
jgi:purine nucleoside permease